MQPPFSQAPDFSLPSMGGMFHLYSLNNRNRVALLFPENDALAREALAQVQRQKSEWEERDLVLVVVLPPDCALLAVPRESTLVHIVCDEKGEVWELFGAKPRKTTFFLLGKADFPVALCTDRMPDDAQLFALIDDMPMRQREMREQSG